MTGVQTCALPIYRGEIIEYIDKEVLEVLWKLKDVEKNELGYFIFHQIPRDLKDDVWKKLILKIDKIPVGYNTKDGAVNLSGKVWEYFVGRDKTAISELGASRLKTAQSHIMSRISIFWFWFI